MNINGLLFGFCFGLACFLIGYTSLIGYQRKSYLLPTPWSGAINYAMIPLGLSALLLGFSLALMNTNEELAIILSDVSLFGCIVAIVLNFWQPDFMTPAWYKWLRNNHNDIWPLLVQEALGNYVSWRDNTRTIPELEVWVQEVRTKHNR